MAEDLLVLSALIRREFGLDFSEHLDQLSRRVAARLAQTRCDTLSEYLAHLKSTPDRLNEMHRLIDCVTNHETYFFREQMQLALVCEQIVPRMLDEERRALKLLCVPASTGEEPYSLAMNLLMYDQPVGERIAIYGADVSRAALEIARAGEYRPTSFRGVAPEVIETFFDANGEKRTIRSDVRRLVHFFYANLVDADSLRYAAPYDIIFCRNVMIYFNGETQRRVIDALESVLTPAGYLCLGHADAAADLHTRFDALTFFGTIVYRRKCNIRTASGTA